MNASSAGRAVGSSMGVVGQGFTLSVPQAHLWSFDDPFLYDLDVVLLAKSTDPVQVGISICTVFGQSHVIDNSIMATDTSDSLVMLVIND